MARRKKIGMTIFGIPLWMISGLSVFIIFSVIYDLVVGDKNLVRYLILGSAIFILLLSIILKFIPAESVGRMARRQMGG